MKNAIVCATFVALFTGVVGHASDKSKLYVSAQYGGAFPTKLDYQEAEGDKNNMKAPNASHVFGASVGYKFNNNFYEELSFVYFNKFRYDKSWKPAAQQIQLKQDLVSYAAFANLFFNIENAGTLVPYLTAGLGTSINKAGDPSIFHDGAKGVNTVFSKTQQQFAWNVGFGLSYKISAEVTLDIISYRYYDLGEVSTTTEHQGESFNSPLKAHVLSTGIKFHF